MSMTSAPSRQQLTRPIAPADTAGDSIAGQSADDARWDRWSRPGPTPSQQRGDIWVGAAVIVGALVATVLVNSMGAFVFGSAPTLGEQLAWGVALTAPLMVRRRYPATVVLIIAALFIAAQVRQIGDNLIPSIALFLAIYSLGAWGRDRVVARWVRVGVIVVMFGWLGVSMGRALIETTTEFPAAAGPLDPLLAAVLHGIGFNLLFFLSAYFFGNVAWESARRHHQLRVQGEQLRRSQAQNARQAVVAERVRIARDLHDVVAHHVSVMGVQAAAARRVFDSDRESASTSLAAVENTARTAIGELRGLLGVLRAGSDPADADGHDGGEVDGSHPSAPGVNQLTDLIEETQATGLHVNHAVYGDPRPVPAALGLSVYRIVQEALTNTVKHAAAASVDIRLRYLDRDLEVEITDDGRGGSDIHAGSPDSGAGLGLLGMRERVSVHGGDLEAGPLRAGGFRVRARFPLAADAASDSSSGAVTT